MDKQDNPFQVANPSLSRCNRVMRWDRGKSFHACPNTEVRFVGKEVGPVTTDPNGKIVHSRLFRLTKYSSGCTRLHDSSSDNPL